MNGGHYFFDDLLIIPNGANAHFWQDGTGGDYCKYVF